jgi:excisionase family DNA binding protein
VDGISVQEAAARLGLSERTIRRRIKAGQLAATQVPTSQGYEWRIHLNSTDEVDTPAVQVDSNAVQLDGTPNQAKQEPHSTSESALVRALDLVEKLQHENLELAGRVGFYQAKLQDAQEQLRLLSAPKEPEKPKARPWWAKLFRK